MKRLLTIAFFMIACMAISAHKTGIYFYFDNVDKHVFEDENVKVFLYPANGGKVCVLVNNKTKKTIYVDNGSSFIYTNGKAASMYRSRATSTGTMYSSGTSVNLGGLAYGLGARGPVTSALSAITVSNGTSDYEGTIISEKRIVPVAPLSTEVVYAEDLSVYYVLCRLGRLREYDFSNNLRKSNWTHSRYLERGNEIKMKKGLSREYTEENTPLAYKTIVHYAFSESMDDPREVTTDNYLKAWAVDKSSGIKNYEYANLPNCEKFKNAPSDYTLFQAKKDGGIGAWDIVGITFGGIAVVLLPVMIIIL